MRDPKRISLLLFKLKKLWQKNPDLRFFQLVGNLAGELQDELKQDIFFTEDDKTLKFIEQKLKEI